MVWLTFIYVWRAFTHTSTSDWYSLDKRLISPAAWFVSIQRRIVSVRAPERPIPLPLGSYTGAGALGRQRGLQRVWDTYAGIRLCAHAHARARDSTHEGDCRLALHVLCIMCLDTTGVSKSTVSVASGSVSIWHGRGVSPMGTYRCNRRERPR